MENTELDHELGILQDIWSLLLCSEQQQKKL